MVDNSDVHRPGPQGSGPLYERGEAGQKAAEEPVEIPGSDSEHKDDHEWTDETQATTNRQLDPPA